MLRLAITGAGIYLIATSGIRQSSARFAIIWLTLDKEMEKKEIYKKVKGATVAMAILNESEKNRPFTILGSGFCIDAAGLIVTCTHVISAFMKKSIPQQISEIEPKEKSKEIQTIGNVDIITPYVIFYNTSFSATQLLAIPSKIDCVMAKTDYDVAMARLLPHPAFPGGYPFIEVEKYIDISEGQEIATCGFPLGNYLQDKIGTVTSSFTKGIISSVIPSPGVAIEYLKGFQLDLTATHGNSGGPVFSLSSGKVFGVLQRGICDSEGDILPGITKAEPIYPLLAHNSIEVMKNTPYGSMPQMSQEKT